MTMPSSSAWTRVFAIAVFFLLTATLIPLPAATAAGPSDMSLPNRIPELRDFTTPTIEPGKEGTFNFTFKNRYDVTMADTRFTVEIYKWATIDKAKDIAGISNPPTIVEGYRQEAHYMWGNVDPGSEIGIRFHIHTRGATPEGTYFVRTMVEFNASGTAYVMKSRGYFTNAQWESATDRTNLNDTTSVAGINLTYLEVDGILVDSSFSVKKPIPMWPLYLLIGLTVLFAALAVVFYYVEEEKGHPKFKGDFYLASGKMKEGKRLLKQELKKRRKEGRPGKGKKAEDIDVPDSDDAF